MAFAHLHVHSDHSILDGLSTVPEIVDRVAALGQPAFAITDHGSMGSTWKAAKYGAKYGVKAIAGLEAYIAIGRRVDRDVILVPRDDDGDDDGETIGVPGVAKKRVYEHVTLLAKNETGWRNLVSIHNESANHRAGSKARLIDWDLLALHGEGIIILSGCLGGPVLGPLSRGEQSRAQSNVEKMIAAVGRDNVFIEVMEHGIASESAILPHAKQLADHYGLRLVATNDSHYTDASQSMDHAAWLALQTKSTLASSKYHFHGSGYHLRSEEEMRALRPEPWWQEACDNTIVVADMVEDHVLPEARTRLPAFPAPEGFASADEFFGHLVKEGLAKRFPNGLTSEIVERVNREVDTIKGFGFVDYFLITRDMIVSELDAGGLVGPGRGSAAGSLVAYLLDITQVDPMENGLIFERFLDPERDNQGLVLDLPDIDVDFESARRSVVVGRLKDTWGDDRVTLLGAPGMIKAKAAIKDAARVLGLSPVGVDLAKTVPEFTSLEEMVGERSVFNADFHKVLESKSGARQVVDLALTFNETIRQYSSHASGVIVSSDSLMDLVPMRRDVNKVTGEAQWVTEWDMKDAQEFGLVKFDVLAIRNLDMAGAAMKEINARHGLSLSLYDLPHPNDFSNPQVVKAWQLLSEGRTAGVFQMEGSAMTRLLQDVQAESWEHLSAVIALFRPGPLSANMHTAFAARKNGRESVSYDAFTTDPEEQRWLATVMGETFGIFIYQEQIMALGRVIAGFDGVWSSKLRKAVSKKNASLMAEVGAKLLEDAPKVFTDPVSGVVVSPAFRAETAQAMWTAMQGAASYLFNASHSYCYSLVAFHTAFLKANWPAEYGAATLSVTSDKEKRLLAFGALKSEGVPVLAPSVNESEFSTAPAADGSGVRIGLGEISGLGDSVQTILEARKVGGPFTSLADLMLRAVGEDSKVLGSGQLDALIGSGALDEFGPRYGMMIVSKALREDPHISIPPIEWGGLEKATRQRELVGISCDYHPAQLLTEVFSLWRTPSVGGVEPVGAVTVGALTSRSLRDGEPVLLIGVLTSIVERTYSKGRMAKLVVEDQFGSIECTLFDAQYREALRFGLIPPVGFPVALHGRVQVSSFDRESEDGVSETVERVEVVANNVYAVPVSDPVQGSFVQSVLPRIDLTGGDDGLFSAKAESAAVELPQLVESMVIDSVELFPVPPSSEPVVVEDVVAVRVDDAVAESTAVFSAEDRLRLLLDSFTPNPDGYQDGFSTF